MNADTVMPPAIEALKNGETDRKAADLEEKKREEVIAEAARWQRELDTLMDRASHPERNVEYIDLTTGQPVQPVIEGGIEMAPPGTLAMPMFFSRAQISEIGDLLTRENEIVAEMADLKSALSKPDVDAGYIKFRSGQLADELGLTMRKLYARLTARAEITEDWLHENEDKWRPIDLNTMIARYNQRGTEAMARVRSFLGK